MQRPRNVRNVNRQMAKTTTVPVMTLISTTKVALMAAVAAAVTETAILFMVHIASITVIQVLLDVQCRAILIIVPKNSAANTTDYKLSQLLDK